MDPDTLTQLLQRGFRVTLGATASLIESFQDPQRRDENISKLSLDFSDLSEEWAVKGEATEREARTFVETLLHSQMQPGAASSPADAPPSGSSRPSPPPGVRADIRELTEQLAALRTELEKLREQGGTP